MSTIQDEIFRVEGLQINDGLAVHFAKTATESLQDAELRWLDEIVTLSTVVDIQDGWIALNAEQGLTSSNDINDIKLAYWSSK